MSGYPDVALPGGGSLPASVAQSPLLFQNDSYQFLIGQLFKQLFVW